MPREILMRLSVTMTTTKIWAPKKKCNYSKRATFKNFWFKFRLISSWRRYMGYVFILIIILQRATQVFDMSKVEVNANDPDSMDVFSGNPVPTVILLTATNS